jgi:hypothetical protein
MDKRTIRGVALALGAAAVVAIWAQGTTGGSQAPATGPAQPRGVLNPRWEYRVESLELITGTNERSRNDPEGLRLRQQAAAMGAAREAELRTTVFKALGDQGWELVSVYSWPDASTEEIGVRTNVRFIFKRKIGEVSVTAPTTEKPAGGTKG